MDSQAAARMGDEIAHGAGFLSMVAGAVVGAVVGALVVGAGAATGGLAVVIFASELAGCGLAMGQLVKGITTIFNLPEPTTGVLIRGSPNVFTNSRAAIRAGQDMAAACGGLTSHVPITWPSPLVAEGSKNVYINGFPAARLTCKMVCGAHIKSGSPNVFIGGETLGVAFVWNFESWLHTGLEILGIGALLGGAGYAAVAGWAAFGSFAGTTGGMMAGFEGLGRLGDSLGPGYRDLFQGIAGMGMLLASPKLAGLGKGQATEELPSVVDEISVIEEPVSLYRGDGRGPSIIFDEGFKPRGTSTDLNDYVLNNTKSIFVGTSKSKEVAYNFAASKKGYVYEIDPSGLKGVDVNNAIPDNIFGKESEIAFPGGIPPESIVSAKPVLETGGLGEAIINPIYKGK
jgi:uncharacterized Zn-binding protein involved in type VI secretion